MREVVLFCSFLGFLAVQSNGQSITVKSAADDLLSVKQLTDSFFANYSFFLWPLQNARQINAIQKSRILNISPPHWYLPVFLKINILPVNWTQQFNSHHPFGWNDGAMIPAKGYQTLINTGVYIKAGPLSVQLQPELVYASNSQFETTTDYGATTKGKYQKIFAGQSSIRLNAGGFSLGVSTENLWWGPGIHSSLLMSNNAPSFAHLSFNSSRPVKTAIGSFEWQLVGGKLEYDKNLGSQNYNLQFAHPTGSQSPLNGDWRYFNGLSVT